MNWFQKEITIQPKSRGFHLITQEIMTLIPEISNYQIGIMHIFIIHTSASLTINENADSTVRDDLESHFRHFVSEDADYYTHTFEGKDDMPAHIKSTIIGNSISVPLTNGKLNLGVWQGIYLCEHRNNSHQRKLIVTINGK